MSTHVSISKPLSQYVSEHLASKIPPLYYTENILPANRVLYLHLMLNSYHWYIAEFDRRETFFGFTMTLDHSGNPTRGQWEYFSLGKLTTIQVGSAVVEIDPGWQVRSANAVEYIVQAKGCI